jgi:uncharacterized NAD(P)/FAD-binding protein YdhS/predicted metal-dependent enzyme (double-stranded beta helix superfamily)
MPPDPVTHPGIDPALSPTLRMLVDELEAAGDVVTRSHAVAALGRAEVAWDDVADFVQSSPVGYARRRIARTDAFELLVMTWLPGQGSAPHDHAGSICALRIVRGHVRESFFAPARDGLVDRMQDTELVEGEVIVDASDHIHALMNAPDAPETLVTLHVYAPPLPELRRFAARPVGHVPAAPFSRERRGDAPVVAIVGGGFSGTLVAAHLIRLATESERAVHVALHDRQATYGEGAAYRTVDSRHLLNVPASNMSAWPDRPTDFLDWARTREANVGPGDFLPRKIYGDYVRSAFTAVAREAADGVSAEIRREEIHAIERGESSGWRVLVEGASHDASAVVIATGHRPPDDPLRSRWSGPRTRYVEDPWASLALSAIRADERVLLLGTGLTSVDVLLTLGKTPRIADVIAVSRRGLWPETHATTPKPAIDPRPWLDPVLAGTPSAHALLRGVIESVASAEASLGDWRPAIDGLRPHLTRIWCALSDVERARFLRHVRPFWEVRRHRMAPKIGAVVDDAMEQRALTTIAGRVRSAKATRDGVVVEVHRRASDTVESVAVDWVVNCTGPGAGAMAIPPALAGLIEAGHLEPDAHGLGVRTDEHGCALAQGRPRTDLAIVGTLRKADLWESTAVPELRVQAAAAARAIGRHLGW